MIKKYGTWAIIYLLFALDYFIASKPENKTTTCVFWIALVVFQIWHEILKRSDK
jgi:hypothetical protein